MSTAPLHWRSVFTATMAATLAGIGFGLSMPVLAFGLRDGLGASGTIIGLNAAMGALSTLIAAPLVPRLLHHAPPRRVVALAAMTCAVLFPLFRLMPDVVSWFILRLVLGMGITALFVTSEIWINQLATDATRGRLIGIYSSALGLGFAIGGTLPVATGVAGWPPYLAGAVIFGLASLPLLIPGPNPAPPSDHGAPIAKLGAMFRTAPAIACAALAFGAIEMSGFQFLALYGDEAGLGPRGGAILLALTAFGGVALQPLLGWLSDRTDRLVMLVGCAALTAVGYGVMPFLSQWAMGLYVAAFLMGGACLGIYTLSLAALGDRFKGTAIIDANAGFIFLYGVGSLVAPYGVGLARDALGVDGVPATQAAIAALYCLVALYTLRLTRRR